MVKLEEVANMSASSDAEVLKKAKEMGFKVKNKKSVIAPEEAGMLYEYLTTGINKNAPKIEKKVEEEVKKEEIKEEPQKEEIKKTKDKTEVPLVKKAPVETKITEEKEKEEQVKEEEDIDSRFKTNNFRKKQEELRKQEEELEKKEEPKNIEQVEKKRNYK